MDIKAQLVKPGQICKKLSEPESDDIFIITTQPASINNNEIEVVRLKDLQRNKNQPENTRRHYLQINDIEVIAEDLTAYIKSWNE